MFTKKSYYKVFGGLTTLNTHLCLVFPLKSCKQPLEGWGKGGGSLLQLRRIKPLKIPNICWVEQRVEKCWLGYNGEGGGEGE